MGREAAPGMALAAGSPSRRASGYPMRIPAHFPLTLPRPLSPKSQGPLSSCPGEPGLSAPREKGCPVLSHGAVSAPPGRSPAGRMGAPLMGERWPRRRNMHWGETALPTAGRPPQSPASSRGACLLREVEGVAVGLRVEPAAAERLPQDGVVRLLDALQATNKEPHVRKRVGLGHSGAVGRGTRDGAGLSGPCLRGVLTLLGSKGNMRPPPGHSPLREGKATQSLLEAPSGF